MKHVFAVCCAMLSAACACGQTPVVRWDVETGRQVPQPVNLTLRRGEAVSLQPRFLNYNAPMRIATNAAVEWRQAVRSGVYLTNTVPGVVMADTGRVSISWGPWCEGSNSTAAYEIAVSGTMLRAYGTLTLLAGVGDPGGGVWPTGQVSASAYALLNPRLTAVEATVAGIGTGSVDLVARAMVTGHETNAVAHAGLFDAAGSAAAVSNAAWAQVWVSSNDSTYTSTVAAAAGSVKYDDAAWSAVSNRAMTAITNQPDLTPYLRLDGTRAMTGNLDMGGNSITNVGTNSIIFANGLSLSASSNRLRVAGADVYTTANPPESSGTTYTFDPMTLTANGTHVRVADWMSTLALTTWFNDIVRNEYVSGGFSDGIGFGYGSQGYILDGPSEGEEWKAPWYAATLIQGFPAPAAHWKMNDNAASTDVVDSISTNTGTAAQNTSGMSTAGKTNTALAFNGSSDKILVGNNQAFHFGAGDFAITLWAKTGTGGGLGELFHMGSLGAPGEIRIFYESAQLKVTLKKDGGSIADEFVDDDTASGSTWYHYVLTRTGSSFAFYVNGSATWGKTSSDALLDEGTGIEMGHGDAYFDGLLDDVRVYTQGLSAAQVTAIYNAGAGTEEESVATVNHDMTLISTNSLIGIAASNAWLMASIGTTNRVLTTNLVRLAVRDASTGATNWGEGLAWIAGNDPTTQVYRASITNAALGADLSVLTWVSSNMPSETRVRGAAAVFAP